ncbi:STAS domain-containing protein [Kitasatospora sp. NPDC059571]|uniref:STAS domain-containing protein n=1 Tax=Kitasatospora sp. NPDC059571 TaxID=3346871 RepID=UPI0036B22565
MTVPTLKTSTSWVGTTAVCTFVGDVLPENVAVMAGALEAALDGAPAMPAANLSEVDLFTSTGLNMLLTVRRTAAGRDVPLVLIAPSAGVRRVLQVTEADALFPVYASTDQARAAREAGQV